MQLPTSGPTASAGPGPPPSRAIPGAYFALVVLFSMNLLNYVDRYVFAAVGPSITNELGLDDGQFGYLVSAFMIVYTIVAPAIGWMGDRYSRRRLLAFGVALWSVATVGTAFAQSFWQMFFWRALLGVGEASYGVVAPTLLADLFPPRQRGRVMGVFYLALPLGGALGYRHRRVGRVAAGLAAGVRGWSACRGWSPRWRACGSTTRPGRLGGTGADRHHGPAPAR
jgi:MFS family permease